MNTKDQNELGHSTKIGSHILSADHKKGFLAFILIVILFFIEVKIIEMQSQKVSTVENNRIVE